MFVAFDYVFHVSHGNQSKFLPTVYDQVAVEPFMSFAYLFFMKKSKDLLLE